METTSDLAIGLNRLQDQIKTGEVVLILGPNVGCHGRIADGDHIPSTADFVKHIRDKFDLSDPESQNSSLDAMLDYCLSEEFGKDKLNDLINKYLICRYASSTHKVISQFVWHRIYSFDVSDALEMAYRQNYDRSQYLIRRVLTDPITPPLRLSENVELIKLHGTAGGPDLSNIFNTSGYSDLASRSRWHDQMLNDLETHPVILLGEHGDTSHLVSVFRRLRLREATGTIHLVSHELTGLQTRTIQNLPIHHLPFSAAEFLSALSKSMPSGRRIGDILVDTADIAISPNDRLAATLVSDFELLTRDRFHKLSDQTKEPRGGIRRFYRGEEVTWSDILGNVVADVTPYRNFRGRIDNELNKGFPAGTIFVLVSPAGMGKTVGLMSTAYWLRQQVNVPILWFRSEGDLGRLFDMLDEDDFKRGAYIFVDDVALFNQDIEGIPASSLERFCFITASRETRWLRYGPTIREKFGKTVEEQIRKLNRNDATAIRDKIAEYGTLIHLKSTQRNQQIDEILNRSGRDLLVLIKELGQGQKFESILQSEVDGLSDVERLCYFLVCIPDRVQVPLPVDLLRRAVTEEYPHLDFAGLIAGLGRLIQSPSGSQTVRSRHSIIAARVVEDPTRRDPIIRRRAVEAFYRAFSHYQIPIIVHHSNTAHARVFKAIVNNRFLLQLFGPNEALTIYRTYEKAFEQDAFYWQQFGLCYLRTGEYSLAIETLTHASTLHEHPLIKHSLGVAKLTACLYLGPEALGKVEFDRIRKEGQRELGELHEVRQSREDIAISSLVDLDIKIARRFDVPEKTSEIERDYHMKLAMYLRAHPTMGQARKIYEQLHGALTLGAMYVGLPADDAIEADL